MVEQLAELSKKPVTVLTPDLAATLSAVQAYLERRHVDAETPARGEANPEQETTR